MRPCAGSSPHCIQLGDFCAVIVQLSCSAPWLFPVLFCLQRLTSAGMMSSAAAQGCASACPGCVMGITTAGTGLTKPTALVSAQVLIQNLLLLLLFASSLGDISQCLVPQFPSLLEHFRMM